MDTISKPSKLRFLWAVFLCSLASYGGPEAHYGVFSVELVEKKSYISEEELTELIGLFSLVPGPSSTQTIMAIGYHVGGPLIALLTLLIWILPAVVIMSLVGVLFSHIDGNAALEPILTYLPTIALCFIVYAGINMTKKVIHGQKDWVLFGTILLLSFLLTPLTIWAVPLLLISSGLLVYLRERSGRLEKLALKPNWWPLGLLVSLAALNEFLTWTMVNPWLNMFNSFYRYGYSIIGGGQVIIPLMIQDLVEKQSLLANQDFLAGYAIDQAVPGPLFSFASFVAARSFSGTGFSFVAGLLGGLSIFLPGVLLVYFMFGIWKSFRQLKPFKLFLKGVSIAAASLIVMTGLSQLWQLPLTLPHLALFLVGVAGLLSKKIMSPLLVLLAILLGFLF